MKASIVTLPGDGIGPEVTAAAVATLEIVATRFGHAFLFDEHPIGGGALDRGLPPLPDSTLAAARAADAVLLGAVGGPRWDAAPSEHRPERGLLRLRQGLGVFANLRPVRPHPALLGISPLRPEHVVGVDLLFVRELTGGLYFAEPKWRRRQDGTDRAVDTLAYDEHEIRRVVELAFRLAADRRSKVTSIDKANVLQTSRLWRDVATAIGHENPAIALDHQLVDSAAMRLLTDGASFDVLVTENMFGDILTDEAAALVGSLGLLPSASLSGLRGDASGPGLYEPIHGSAPDIAGQGIANPLGAILSAALLLRWSLGLETEARAIESAVEAALDRGLRTADLRPAGEMATTAEATRAVIREIESPRAE
jgi:3-isopropylmalate dehydrogenase